MGKSYENLGGHLTELKLDHKNGKEKSDQLTEFLGRIFYIESYGCSGHRFSICIFNTAPGTMFTSQVTPRGYVGFYFFWVVRPCLLHGAVLMDGIKNCDLQHPGDDDDDDDATSWIRELITYNREVPPQD